jgi:F0F1-type ATP synthase assembly protein I
MASSPGHGPSGAELIGLGVLLAASFVVPIVLGVLLDGALRTSPVFVFVGLAAGILAAIGVVYARYVKRYW